MPISSNEIVRALKILKKRFPNPGAMEIGTPFQALVGVALSARTRDEQVIKLLPGFFQAFPNVRTLAAASVGEIGSHINTIGMYRQKARHLKAMSQKIETVFRGRVPETMEELITLPGVGRKTASVILVYCFKKSAIAVDTHVHRVTNRLGWVKTKTPAQTERALLKLVPKAWHKTVNRVFVKHGRYLCLPQRPRCFSCPLVAVCAYKNKQLHVPKNKKEIEEDIARREANLLHLKSAVV